MTQKIYFISFLILSILLTSCSTIKTFLPSFSKKIEVPKKSLSYKKQVVWKALKEELRYFELEMDNFETGQIKTRWIDNTNQLSKYPFLGAEENLLASKYRLIINVNEIQRPSKTITTVSFFKKHLISKGYFKEWESLPTDGIIENILLYRLGKNLKIKKKIARLKRKKKRGKK